jgi:hypothetical protein
MTPSELAASTRVDSAWGEEFAHRGLRLLLRVEYPSGPGISCVERVWDYALNDKFIPPLCKDDNYEADVCAERPTAHQPQTSRKIKHPG